ncbi:MAG: 3-oxoacyl-ACP synthase III family protein [Segniliparus sp.]|uniref:3-oxoacyl-ACP synthase III family protein n=1 Tax=Segniliparus sp. TaxID=2804064 RepID=UPI003F305D04
MTTLSLVDIASYLPKNRVSADWYAHVAESDELSDNVMFKAPKFRHHVAKDETAVDMIERAAAGIVERHGAQAITEADVLIMHTQLPDLPFVGCGGEVAQRLGMKPTWILDIHNGGCAAFPHMISIVQKLLAGAAPGTKAVIAAAQNCAGQIFTQPHVRTLSQAAIPGDGAGVGLLEVSDASPILGVEWRNYGQYAGEMIYQCDPPRKYWEPGEGEGHVGFTESKIVKVLARGNRQVPEVAHALCERIGVASKDLDLLVTNQPNRLFLRNWREALEVPAERHPDTFDECGNLFAAGIPVTFDHAVSEGRVKKGDIVMFAAFAHAGDFAGATAVRWGGRP